MLSKALQALGQLPGPDDEVAPEDVARLVVLAMSAAAAERDLHRARIEAQKGGLVYPEVEPHEATATAYWMWSEGVDLDLSEVPPASNAGRRYLAFAQGMAACRAMNEAMAMLDDSMFAFSELGADELATIINRSRNATASE